MERTYDVALLNAIKEKEYVTQINGIDVLMKPIPEKAEEGMMDPRLYASSKKSAAMMKLMPKSMLKMDASRKTVERLRGMFNGVKSIPIASAAIEVIDTTIPASDGYEIPAKIYLPQEKKEHAPILYYIHGGGFFAGHMGVVDQLVKLIVEKFHVYAVSIEYRLAPETPYPRGHEDCYDALHWIKAHMEAYGADPTRIYVAGDSAGGNLAQYCTTRDLEEHTHLIKGQLLLYPTVNLAGIQDAYTTWSIDRYTIHPEHKEVVEASLSLMQGDKGMSSLLGEILGAKETNDPYLTPYGMDLTGMPPTFLTVGQHDFLYVECLAYARKLIKANVDAKIVVYCGMGHAYGDNIGVYPQSEDCAMEMGNFILAQESRGSDEKTGF